MVQWGQIIIKVTYITQVPLTKEADGQYIVIAFL